MKERHASQRRSYWLKTLHTWHWISSAICLLGMLLFAFTGLTLNNASHIESKARVETRHTRLPYAELAAVKEAATRRAARLPQSAGAWLEREFGIDALRVKPEWSSEEAYLSLPRAGGDAWLSIDIQSGEVEYERTDRGWISYLNDLHKGRHTGLAWSWFLDLFALACLVFSLTGLVLLKMHAGHRAATWPMVGLGVVIPVVLALLFIH
ncbi:PepSY-associated TM helix domain-containing protein [Bordetella holmesii]|uniref:PepSY-associated TM helix family protein n=2 Tax=Bordetella holmesii TaxID=35814 RepID=A0ABN0RWB7_9BORD|nr:PepSY-associated TM helix domain-containing protein [Bordetella holmesii]AHV91105.1 pepSY-associated TM helix family protein [Bordetella holmesii ATCC 51541]AIT27536.1 pepSY-associated TM helix family protein [Bordetella holmesii 44057]EWM42671.1 pepSY-associated TM helix family protein [Bordetella holmesii 41130]EWM48128.1 pepSY-associated TM helix family protein [Bordetella holmesii 35009]EWM49109.1 pepSY-associated TM helix family protein [Bordetella holmesii 70147]